MNTPKVRNRKQQKNRYRQQKDLGYSAFCANSGHTLCYGRTTKQHVPCLCPCHKKTQSEVAV